MDRIYWISGDDTFDYQSRLERRNVTNERFEYFPLDVVDSANIRCKAYFYTRTYGYRRLSSEDFDLKVEGNLNTTKKYLRYKGSFFMNSLLQHSYVW